MGTEFSTLEPVAALGLDDALARYQHRRDVLTANGFELALTTARLAPLSARLEAFYRTAAEQPELTAKVFGVLGGTIPIADLYPDHVPVGPAAA